MVKMERHCCRCNTVKPITDFYKNQYYCKICAKDYRENWKKLKENYMEKNHELTKKHVKSKHTISFRKVLPLEKHEEMMKFLILFDKLIRELKPDEKIDVSKFMMSYRQNPPNIRISLI